MRSFETPSPQDGHLDQAVPNDGSAWGGAEQQGFQFTAGTEMGLFGLRLGYSTMPLSQQISF